MKKKRICFPFTGDSIGGSHISTMLMIEELEKNGFELMLIIHKEGVLSSYFDEKNIKYIIHPLYDFVGSSKSKVLNLIYLLISIPVIIYLIRKYNISIVHSNDMRIHQTWVIPSFLTKKTFIWHQRTKFPNSRLSRFLVKFCSKVICISKYVKSSIPREVNKEIRIIANPIQKFKEKVNVEKFRSQISKNHSQKKIISFFANLQKIKEPMMFAEVAKELYHNYSKDLFFVFFGSDKELFIPKIKEFSKINGLSNNFFYMGFKSPIEPWIKSSDLILVTSSGDGFGRTILEAMSLKTSFIATNIGGHKELVKHNINGILVEKGDIQSMVSNSIKLLNQSTLKNKLLSNAIKFSEKFYSSKLVFDYKKLYE